MANIMMHGTSSSATTNSAATKTTLSPTKSSSFKSSSLSQLVDLPNWFWQKLEKTAVITCDNIKKMLINPTMWD